MALAEGGLGLRKRGGACASTAFLGSCGLCYQGVARATGYALPSDLTAAPVGSIAHNVGTAVTTCRAFGVTEAASLASGSG